MSKIRKISIGSNYKTDAMHYSIGQEVYGGHIICDIINSEACGEYLIYIKKDEEVLPWKSFNANMAIAVEFDLQY